MGDPVENVPSFVMKHKAMAVITDFSPLRVSLGWVKSVSERLDSSSVCPLYQVDAHNIIPCWIASPKLEYGARTIRNKIQSQIPEFLKAFPLVTSNDCASYLDGCDKVFCLTFIILLYKSMSITFLQLNTI
jgi:deoxyribodipyrimidine photo-lyase